MEVIYLDTCQSDYFNGYNGHVYAIEIYKLRVWQVKNALLDAVKNGEVYQDGAYLTDIQYQELLDSVNPLFKGVDLRRSWSGSSNEGCYVFFGVSR